MNKKRNDQGANIRELWRMRVANIGDAEARRAAEMQRGDGLTGQMIGLDASLPKIRSFTRAEVLAILRALKADTGVVASKEGLDRAIRVFEGME